MLKLIDVYESKGKTEVLKNLALVQFKNTIDLNDRYMWDDSNTHYNTEASKFNSLLDQFVTYLDISGDREFAIQIIRFVKPIVVPLPDTTGNGSGVRLSTQPQDDIKKKLGL
ncbi:MAG: hypothetical protein R3Y68_03975 [Rikenellaceae bacterium]